MMQWPLLKGDMLKVHPADQKCPVCKTHFADSSSRAYLSSGAVLLNGDGDSVDDDRLRAHFYILIKTRKHSQIHSSGAMLVDDLAGGQFDFIFCSAVCLRKWVNQLIDDLEASVEPEA